MRFKINRSRDLQFYFEIQAAGNYETLATSETYRTETAARQAIALIKSGASGGTIVGP